MKIAKVWDCEYPWDVRVEKVVGALLQAGHEVDLFCRNRRGDAQRENIGDLRVHRMPVWRSVGGRLENASSFPAFVNPRWINFLFRRISEVRPDLVLCRDVPLAPLALQVGKRLGVPVVVDIAENYPAMLKHLFHPSEFRPHNLLVRNPYFAAAVERYVVRSAAGLVAVVEESRERLIRLGAAPERVAVASNTPTPQRIEALSGIRRDGPREDGPPRLVYLGLLERDRGLDVVLHALAQLREAGLEVHFDVIGKERNRQLRRLTQRLALEGQVRFHGYIPYDQALSIVGASDAGVVPHYATEQWNSTIPNKLFDYMAARLPVVVADAVPMRRIVRGARCGLVFRSGDAADLASQIRRLWSAEVREEFGAAGRRAVEEHYNWNRDGALLVEHLEAIVESWSGRGRGRVPTRRGVAPASDRVA